MLTTQLLTTAPLDPARVCSGPHCTSRREAFRLSKLPACKGASIRLSQKGDEMPEASRSDAPLRNPRYPHGNDESGRANYTQRDLDMETSLPSGDIYGNSRVSRSAQSFGRSVGHAVSGVLRFPQRVDKARSRLRQAGRETRAKGAAAMLDMMDSAASRADDLRHSTSETLSDWTRTARYKTSHLREQANQSWQELRHTARERLAYASRHAVTQWNHTQRRLSRLQEEDPARFLAVVAGTAFVIGAGLRVWRSRNE